MVDALQKDAPAVQQNTFISTKWHGNNRRDIILQVWYRNVRAQSKWTAWEAPKLTLPHHNFAATCFIVCPDCTMVDANALIVWLTQNAPLFKKTFRPYSKDTFVSTKWHGNNRRDIILQVWYRKVRAQSKWTAWEAPKLTLPHHNFAAMCFIVCPDCTMVDAKALLFKKTLRPYSKDTFISIKWHGKDRREDILQVSYSNTWAHLK